MLKENEGLLVEEEYLLYEEMKNASLFTTGNGYVGVRGSLEEFGSSKVQGCYIRGHFGEIVEIVEPIIDNEYMKNYYFDEQALKDFDKQESVINVIDFLLVRFVINGEVFLPWKSRIISWKRYIDIDSAMLVRKCVCEQKNGNITEFEFKRFASYDNIHNYHILAKAKPINYDGEIEIISGFDTMVRTHGQKVLKEYAVSYIGNSIYYQNIVDNKYFNEFAAVCTNNYYINDVIKNNLLKIVDNDGLRALSQVFSVKKNDVVCVEKTIYFESSVDEGLKGNQLWSKITCQNKKVLRFNEYFELHKEKWNKYFDCFKVTISGDREINAKANFCNYHTAISYYNDNGIHSFSAKNLTGEGYNDFVWWDAEIYQAPIFLYCCPDIAKSSILYRYKLLGEAKKIAKEQNMKGAKYPFLSGITGKEMVWKYARHPKLQIHINSDIAFFVIKYFNVTNDNAFMENYGLRIINEISRYWISRCTKENGKYVINNVTGTDEHHPYVNNDAYTNYITYSVLSNTIEINKMFSIKDVSLDENEISSIKDIIQKIYLPTSSTGVIPQFDGYFNLNEKLEETNGEGAKSFQMKKSGLYHKSQIIKQPDVLMLFSYIDDTKLNFTDEAFLENYNYYIKRCEASSSLTYSPHAICAIQLGKDDDFIDDYNKIVSLDIDDIHNCSKDGVHAGCMAGAWYSLFRGVLGIRIIDDYILINPIIPKKWKELELNFEFKKIRIYVKLLHDSILFKKHDKQKIKIKYKGKFFDFDQEKIELRIEL